MQYAVILRPGYYGDSQRVVSAHKTPEAAVKAAARWAGYEAVHMENARKGRIIFRVNIQNGLYPRVCA